MGPEEFERVLENQERRYRLLLEEQRSRTAEAETRNSQSTFESMFNWMKFALAALTVIGVGGTGFVAGDLSDGDLEFRRQQEIEREHPNASTLTFDEVEDIQFMLTCPEKIRSDLGPSGPSEIVLFNEVATLEMIEATYGVLVMNDQPPFSYESGYLYACKIVVREQQVIVNGFEVPIEKLVKDVERVRSIATVAPSLKQ